MVFEDDPRASKTKLVSLESSAYTNSVSIPLGWSPLQTRLRGRALSSPGLTAASSLPRGIQPSGMCLGAVHGSQLCENIYSSQLWQTRHSWGIQTWSVSRGALTKTLPGLEAVTVWEADGSSALRKPRVQIFPKLDTQHSFPYSQLLFSCFFSLVSITQIKSTQ